MTTIILTIIGVLIAAAAALMVVWYGGGAFSTGVDKARASEAINNITQVAAAVTLHNRVTGSKMPSRADNIDTLVSESYLTSAPRNAVTNASGVYHFVDRTGLDESISSRAKSVFWVSQEIGSDTDPHARAVCRQIENSMGDSNPGDHVDQEIHFEDWTATHGRISCIDNYWSKNFVLMAPV